MRENKKIDLKNHQEKEMFQKKKQLKIPTKKIRSGDPLFLL